MRTVFFEKVFAENQIGRGDAQTSSPVVAKYPFDPPSPPNAPECRDVTRDEMTVTWDAPICDGGGEVTGYYLEMRVEGAKNWMRVMKKPLSAATFSYRVTGLTKDKAYCFRFVLFKLSNIFFHSVGGGAMT